MKVNPEYLCPKYKSTNICKTYILKLKSYMKPHTLKLGDFITPFLTMGRSNRQKFNRDSRELTDVMNQIVLTGIYRTFYPNKKEYTF